MKYLDYLKGLKQATIQDWTVDDEWDWEGYTLRIVHKNAIRRLVVLLNGDTAVLLCMLGFGVGRPLIKVPQYTTDIALDDQGHQDSSIRIGKQIMITIRRGGNPKRTFDTMQMTFQERIDDYQLVKHMYDVSYRPNNQVYKRIILAHELWFKELEQHDQFTLHVMGW